MMTPRMLRPAIMSSQPWLTWSRVYRVVISSESLILPARYRSRIRGMSSNGFEDPNSAPCSRFSNSDSMNPEMFTVLFAGPASPVSTTMPRLRMASNAAETTSSVTTPIVTIAWSAPTPQVSSSARACASSVVATACVAPNLSADSRLNSTGSTAMTYRAPAIDAPCSALCPTPPTPYTMVVSPGLTSPAFTAEPKPVGTPHDTSAASSSGMSSSIFTTEASDNTARWENVPRRHICPKSVVPSWYRNVPSGRQLSTRNLP